MGSTRMGKYDFSSWTLHMASITIFSTLLGIAIHEGQGTRPRIQRLVAIGFAVLIVSTVFVGYFNYLGASPNH